MRHPQSATTKIGKLSSIDYDLSIQDSLLQFKAWPTQPSIEELENLLVSQETLAKQMAGVSSSIKEVALFAHRRRNQHRSQTRK